MDRRAHFLLRATAVAVLLAEAVYPHHGHVASGSGAPMAATRAPTEAPAPTGRDVTRVSSESSALAAR